MLNKSQLKQKKSEIEGVIILLSSSLDSASFSRVQRGSGQEKAMMANANANTAKNHWRSAA
jgi:hypothetical protein